MSCPPLTNKGGKLYISEEPVDCDLTLFELAVLPYVFVPGVGSIGDTGIEQDVVTYPVTDAGLTSQGKGDATARNWDVEMMDAPSEARDILDEASAVGNDDNYATRIEWPNGDVEFSIVQVASRTAVKGAASGVRVIRYTMIPSFIPIVTNSLPVASNVTVTGIMSVGYTLTGTYDYYSPLGLPESGSDYQWFVSALPDGSDATPILGAGAITFEIPPEYADMYLSFQVIPSDGMNDGAAVVSPADGPVVSETPLDLFVDGADGFWYNPADFSTLWADEAKTTNASAPGQSIWWINDLSPNENHAKAASEGARGVLYRWPASAVLEGYPRNRLIATDTMATQSVTVLAEQMTVSFKGTGTVTLSGESTAGPLVGTGAEDIVSLTFTPTAGSLTLTVAGSVTEAQLEPGAARTTYQSVGAAIWDVTEEGQADCWGVAFDGVTARYLSARGIPLFVDRKGRMLVGQTKLGVDGVSGGSGWVLSNSNTISSSGAMSLFSHSSTASYTSRIRIPTEVIAGTGLAYPSPNTAVMDSMFKASSPAFVDLQINNATLITASSPADGTINSNVWGLGSLTNGSQFYNGIIWGCVMVAEEPDEAIWNESVRDWLSWKMGGILS